MAVTRKPAPVRPPKDVKNLGGRPPFRWTQDMENRILQALSAGASYKDAAEFAGLSYQTLLRKQQTDSGFSDRLAHARSTFKVKSLAYIANAAKTEWRAAAWWLERAYREEWGQQLEASIAVPAGIGPELVLAAGIRSNDAAIHEIHLALALSIAAAAAPAPESEPRSVGSSGIAGGVCANSNEEHR